MTVLQQKVADAHGLAIAATVVAGKVGGERRDAEEIRARCERVENDEQRARAIVVHERTLDLMHAWFTAGTDPLSAWSFLAMIEAAQVTTWAAVTELAVQANDAEVAALAAWALPLKQEHLAAALRGAVRLASLEDARAPRFG
jgi:hypothetical protein